MYRKHLRIKLAQTGVDIKSGARAHLRARRGLTHYYNRNVTYVSSLQPTNIRALAPCYALSTSDIHPISFFSTAAKMGSNIPNSQASAVRIRKADPSDAGQIAAVGTAVFTHTFRASGCTEAQLQSYLDEAYTPDAILSTLTSPSHYTLVAVDQASPSTILGFALLNTGSTEPVIDEGNYTRPVELQRLYVSLNAHGRGIGKGLMAEAERVAREEWAKETMWLGVWESNAVAQGLYGKLGFKRVGKHAFDVGGDIQTDWIMVKALR
ncbi:hypothetical protein N0V93_009576 [Gnomoniopsis smithogilvyi]|uniref:N-acetyltransferase domain-containing protein n=1 Tax=Gnomoniopsis smithogilvyi TaxID=1191159 RepID=A0A9W8YL39_9PEZI|nr:hypothetical protein N0V93_009576 [Gnomoniopsis smithogilvyi]